jgi:hypothetical protein
MNVMKIPATTRITFLALVCLLVPAIASAQTGWVASDNYAYSQEDSYVTIDGRPGDLNSGFVSEAPILWPRVFANTDNGPSHVYVHATYRRVFLYMVGGVIATNTNNVHLWTNFCGNANGHSDLEGYGGSGVEDLSGVGGFTPNAYSNSNGDITDNNPLGGNEAAKDFSMFAFAYDESCSTEASATFDLYTS